MKRHFIASILLLPRLTAVMVPPVLSTDYFLFFLVMLGSVQLHIEAASCLLLFIVVALLSFSARRLSWAVLFSTLL
jgi:hypothetical protein